jgi:hypothetical protein
VDRHHYTSPFEFTGNLDKVVITVRKSAAGEKQTEQAEVGVTQTQ